MIGDTAGVISEELPPGCPEEVLKRISATAFVKSFTLKRHKRTLRWGVELVSVTSLQLPTSKPTRAPRCIQYTGYRSLVSIANPSNDINALRKNINSVTSPHVTCYIMLWYA